MEKIIIYSMTAVIIVFFSCLGWITRGHYLIEIFSNFIEK